MMFRIAKTERCAGRCVELQKLVTNETGQPEWVHYCILARVEQALEVVREKEPKLVAQAEKDLAAGVVLDAKEDPSLEVRIAKHIRGWRDEPTAPPRRGARSPTG